MQMVSASKMRKSQAQALSSRSYAELAMELVQSLSAVMSRHDVGASRRDNLDSGSEAGMTRLLHGNPKASKIAVVIISTNKGLVGGFNANLFLKLRELEKEHVNTRFELVVVGRKISEAVGRAQKEIIKNRNL